MRSAAAAFEGGSLVLAFLFRAVRGRRRFLRRLVGVGKVALVCVAGTTSDWKV